MKKAKSRRRSLVKRADSLIRQWDGKLTQELARKNHKVCLKHMNNTL
jgi:hypothetical protein